MIAGLVPSSGLASDWTTFNHDNVRSGYDPDSPAATQLHLVWSQSVTGSMYAQPLVYNGAVIVATEDNVVESFDAHAGSLNWTTGEIAPPVPQSSLPCGNIGPNVGITGTPAIDPASGTLYAAVFSNSGSPHYELAAIRLSDGAHLWSEQIDPTSNFDPLPQGQRPALSLANGYVFIEYGGRDGDCGSYHGWVVAGKADGSLLTGPALQDLLTQNNGGGIWDPGGGAIDPTGLYVVTGNTTDCCPGNTYDHSNTVARLSLLDLSLQDSWAPSDWASLSQFDTDVSAVNPEPVDDNQILQVGKSGSAYLLNRASLGGIGGQVATINGLCNGAYGGSAFVSPNAYVPCRDGIHQVIIGNGTMRAGWHNTNANNTPVYGGGLLWAMSSCHVYGIDPSNGATVYSATQNCSASSFPALAVANGYVYSPGDTTLYAYLIGTVGQPGTLQAVFPALANAAYGGYTTRVYVENLGSAAASMSLLYKDSSGQVVGVGDSIASLPPHALWEVRQSNGNGLGVGEAGSGFVYSTQPVATFVNEFGPAGDPSSYTGLPAAGSATLYAPAIARDAFGGYTTGIGIVNLGTAAVSPTITYRDSSGQTVKIQNLASVPAGGYVGVYSGTTPGGLASDANLPDGFAGTASITAAGGQLAATVNEVGPGGAFGSYDAVPTGATAIFLPAIYNGAYGGYYTGVNVQNTSSAAGSVTVTYYDSQGAAVGNPITKAIAGNGYLALYSGDPAAGPPPSGSGYTARLSSTVALAATSNEVQGNLLTSYNGFTGSPSLQTLPLVENQGQDGWSTGVDVMNSGTSNAAVTVTFYNASSGAQIGQTSSTLGAGAFWGIYMPALGLPPAGQRATALVSASGGSIAVICNEAGPGQLMSYDGQ